MLFPSETVDILKLDFLFDAGTASQTAPLCAASTASLMPRATVSLDALRLSEYLDHRGILVDTVTDIHTTVLTAYLLPKYAADFFPILHEILTAPAFPEDEFRAHCRRMKQTLTTNLQRTSYVARNLFCQALYGIDRPEGRFAVPDDVDRLERGMLCRHFEEHYSLERSIMSMSGRYNTELLERYRNTFGSPDSGVSVAPVDRDGRMYCPEPTRVELRHTLSAPGPQASIRIGRLLPFSAQDEDFAPFAVLCTVLGGYFGSRLMRNIREDKGYTYGIYCRTRLHRSSLYFEIVSDVAADCVEQALGEVYREMDALCRELLSDEELQLVRSYMEGEYMRSIDGVFERADRWQQLASLGIDEAAFSQRLLSAIRHTSAGQLLQLAQRYLIRDAMTEVVVF
ncbi:MAG: peptidase M16 domain-containing protein [bacterium P3]|nr:MAG: peptidase M16 domain-containing protein [bacterium P3]KWW42011.1 MAG: peptidase M16 domain-containing protein [bacterium F083]